MTAVGGVWRLLARRPLFEFDGSRVKLHPSIFSAPLALAEIDRVQAVNVSYMGGTAPLLQIRLMRWYWSLDAKVPSKMIELRFPGRSSDRDLAAKALKDGMAH
ncbi:MAG: hypothetical protein RL339_2820 [Pseudomonadota bacterium]